jgi:hypothetical protein
MNNPADLANAIFTSSLIMFSLKESLPYSLLIASTAIFAATVRSTFSK